MKASEWRALWLPVFLCVIVADLNFWYWASTGENDLDYGGILFFLVLALVWFRSFIKSRGTGDGIRGIGALLSIVLMILRETGRWDHGYIPPYIVFIVFVFLAKLVKEVRGTAGKREESA